MRTLRDIDKYLTDETLVGIISSVLIAKKLIKDIKKTLIDPDYSRAKQARFQSTGILIGLVVIHEVMIPIEELFKIANKSLSTQTSQWGQW